MRALTLLLAGCGGDTSVVLDDPAGTTPAGTADSGAEVVGLDGTCDPGAPPVYVEEGEPVSVPVRCTGEGTADSFAIADLPEGASFDGATLTWTPGLDAAGHYTVEVVSRGEEQDAGTLEIWVADAWADASNSPVDPETYTYEYGLPVLHLHVPPDTNFDTDVATTLTYRGHTYDVDLQYRGASSAYYPKKSFTVSFPSDDEFDDADEGFANRRAVALTTLFDDNAYVRQQLCYEVWSALDPDRPTFQTMQAVLYVNGEYEGLYLLSDHIDGEWFEDAGYDEDWHLYKSIDHAANFYDNYNGSPKSSWHQGYEKRGEADDDWSDLDALVQWAAQSDADTFRAELYDRFAENDLIDWWILVRFTEADDSGGKNAYLYFDQDTGMVHHVPWDFNHSFGQTWQTEREPADTDYDFFWSNNLFARALTDGQLAPAWEARMRAALDGPLSVDAIEGRLDAHVDRAWPSMQRDWDKWGESYRTYDGWYWREDWTDPEGEVEYLRQWIEDRHGYMDAWYP